MVLAVVQAASFSVCAYANEASPQEFIALAQPSSVQTGRCKEARLEETVLIEAQNQFVQGVAIYASTFGGDEAKRLAQEGVFIGPNSGENYIDLQGGNILLNPEKDLIVATQSGKIHVGAGAVVFIIDSIENTVIYDLLQTKPKQVIVTVNKHSLLMEPGRMFVLTRQHFSDFEQLPIDCHRVNYRNAQVLKLNNSSEPVKVVAADFSITSAMLVIEPLKRITVSGNREDKLTMDKMLKGAVVLGGFSTDTSQPNIVDDSPLTAKADSVQAISGSERTIAQ
jgi:hypothetical protein